MPYQIVVFVTGRALMWWKVLRTKPILSWRHVTGAFRPYFRDTQLGINPPPPDDDFSKPL